MYVYVCVVRARFICMAECTGREIERESTAAPTNIRRYGGEASESREACRVHRITRVDERERVAFGS